MLYFIFIVYFISGLKATIITSQRYLFSLYYEKMSGQNSKEKHANYKKVGEDLTTDQFLKQLKG